MGREKGPLRRKIEKAAAIGMVAMGISGDAEAKPVHHEGDPGPPIAGEIDPGDSRAFENLSDDYKWMSQRAPDVETLRYWNNKQIKKYVGEYLDNRDGKNNMLDGLTVEERGRFYRQWIDSVRQAMNRADGIIGVERETVNILIEQLEIIEEETDLYDRLDKPHQVEMLRAHAHLLLKFADSVYRPDRDDYGVAFCKPSKMIHHLNKAEELLDEAIAIQKSLPVDPNSPEERMKRLSRRVTAGPEHGPVKEMEDEKVRVHELRTQYARQR